MPNNTGASRLPFFILHKKPTLRFAFYIKSGIIYKSRICAYIFGVHINKEGVYVRKF